MKILWVKSGPLHPLDTGGKKRTHSMLCEIAKRHEVTYLALRDENTPLSPVEADAPYAQRKVWVAWREARRGSARFFAQLLSNFLFSTKPYSLAKYQVPALADAIDELCAAGAADLVVCDFLFPATNLRDIGSKPPVVLFQHNMEAQIWKRMAAAKRNPVSRLYFGSQFRRMHRWEKTLSERFDAVITVSPEDTAYARDVYGLGNVAGDVPAGVDADDFAPEGSRPDDSRTEIGFLGSMDWMPNIEAVLWFAREIYPLVKRSVADVRFTVIGRRPPAAVRQLAADDPSIEVTGTVDDVRPYLDASHLLVVPLLSGGGTRIKIMEALAAKLPVVSTTVGAEGIGLTDGEHLLIADQPDGFADAVSRLAKDRSLRERLGAAGAELVRAKHGWAIAAETFLEHCRTATKGG